MKAKYGKQLVNLLPFLLFVLFTASVLAVLLTGAKLYGSLSRRDHDAHVGRTAVQYIAAKVRRSGPDSIETAEFDGAAALVIHENLEDSDFVTVIYCQDGYLRELFTFADEVGSNVDGEMLIPMERADFAIEEGLLQVRLTDEKGDLRELTLDITGRERAG